MLNIKKLIKYLFKYFNCNYMLLLLLVFILPIFGVSTNCYDYTMQYRLGDPRTISLEDRENYVGKLCDTLRFCHSDPQLYSFQVYKDDISRCYNQRMYNFDENILEQPNILNYINTLRDLEDAKIRLDTQTAICKDAMTSTVESVRLRSGYLREFQYSHIPKVTGDVLMTLRSEKDLFVSNSDRQLVDIDRMFNVTSLQYNHIEKMLNDIKETSTEIDTLYYESESAKERFREAEWEIEKNVIESLLEVTNLN